MRADLTGRGKFKKVEAPKALVGGEIPVLDVYGSLFYAGARTLQARLPDPGTAVSREVVLRLRGRATLGVPRRGATAGAPVGARG